jgi:predicted metal-dependent enzyme (double-stranded beta helix superfamily)
VLYRSAEITVFNLIWGPWMCQLPHNHGMWALIGIYTGREDNIFWRRPVPSTGRIEAAGARALSEREAMPLGPEIIHSVINPIKRLTGAIHVYGGDFFAVSRSEWDPEHLVEGPYDVAKTLALFEESNRIYPNRRPQTSPRNYPGSCFQREPKRPKSKDVRTANLRGVVCGP